MDSSNLVEKSRLHDWVENETRALDVVASWETLCDAYRILEFSDSISDAIKMEEFKWIIAEMNKHLSRARKKLLSCSDPNSMKEVLETMFSSENSSVTNRMNLTYHKMRQRWVSRMIAQLDLITEMMETEEENGRPDFWNE